MREPLLKGQPIEIGGQPYTLPPLGLDGLELWQELRPQFQEASDSARLRLNIVVVHAALVRNYPELTLEEVQADIHAHEVMELAGILPSLFERSGLRAQGEKKRGAKQKKSTTAQSSAE